MSRFRPFTTRHAIDPAETQARLVELAYELLDAHDDTGRLAAKHADELSWHAHLDYLRDLQRAGRELLAHAQADCAPWPLPDGRQR